MCVLQKRFGVTGIENTLMLIVAVSHCVFCLLLTGSHHSHINVLAVLVCLTERKPCCKQGWELYKHYGNAANGSNMANE